VCVQKWPTQALRTIRSVYVIDAGEPAATRNDFAVFSPAASAMELIFRAVLLTAAAAVAAPSSDVIVNADFMLFVNAANAADVNVSSSDGNVLLIGVDGANANASKNATSSKRQHHFASWVPRYEPEGFFFDEAIILTSDLADK